jgi:hypothetical protein
VEDDGIAPVAMRAGIDLPGPGGVMQIVLSQLIAESERVEGPDQPRQPVPRDRSVQKPEGSAKDP